VVGPNSHGTGEKREIRKRGRSQRQRRARVLTKSNVFLGNEQRSTDALDKNRIVRVVSNVDGRRAGEQRWEALGLQVFVLALQSGLENFFFFFFFSISSN